MRLHWVGIIGVFAGGCVTVEEHFSDSISSAGVTLFQGDVERGRVVYDGSAIDGTFDVIGRNWGKGGGKSAATKRMEDNDFFVEKQGEILVAAGVAWDNRSGTDFDIRGPSLMHVDVIADDGHAEIYDAEGIHVITANSVRGSGIVGDADFYADSSGIDVEILPYADGVIFLESLGGDIDLFVPWGLDYDLSIIGDPDYDLAIGDIGLDTLVIEPGLAIGWRGFREIRVDIICTGGDVRVFPSF